MKPGQSVLEFGRWQGLMARLGLASHRDTFDALCAAYSEPHRAYHTARHISACLRHLDEAADLAGAPYEIEIALWFHDAIYKTRSQGNERLSAGWAAEFLKSAGAPDDAIGRVHGHIIATEHSALPDDPDSALLVDIDLAILGSPPAVYRVFETDIRREYKWVPGPLFRRKRREVLESFLARQRLYATERFRDRFEAAARRNLTSAISVLGGKRR